MATREAGMSAKRREGRADQFRDLEEPAPLLDESFRSLGWPWASVAPPGGATRGQCALLPGAWGRGLEQIPSVHIPAPSQPLLPLPGHLRR